MNEHRRFEATFEDACALSRDLNVQREEIWKIIQGARYSTRAELAMMIHRCFRESAGQNEDEPLGGERS